MMAAPVGDDVFGEDPTVNALETKIANLFNKEAALFCPSGTMCNQIAIKTHTQPLDEVICHEISHIHCHETGGYAFHSGVALKLISGNAGRIQPHQLAPAINPDYDWLPATRLICFENTVNKAGGACYTLSQMQALSNESKRLQLATHLDGARIFNAMVAQNIKPQQVGPLFDSISVCLSKGLGAPIGSVLLGTAAFIKKARRLRKVMGGGMRQAGILAAAGIYALENHIDRLTDDHRRAKILGQVLANYPDIVAIHPVETNIIVADFASELALENFLVYLQKNQIKAIAFGPKTVRLVTHLDITEADLEKVCSVLKQ
jgi:threonine aldolase